MSILFGALLALSVAEATPEPPQTNTQTEEARPSGLTPEQEERVNDYAGECTNAVTAGIFLLELEAARRHTWARYTGKLPDGTDGLVAKETYMAQRVYLCTLDRLKHDPVFQFRGPLLVGQSFG